MTGTEEHVRLRGAPALVFRAAGPESGTGAFCVIGSAEDELKPFYAPERTESGPGGESPITLLPGRPDGLSAAGGRLFADFADGSGRLPLRGLLWSSRRRTGLPLIMEIEDWSMVLLAGVGLAREKDGVLTPRPFGTSPESVRSSPEILRGWAALGEGLDPGRTHVFSCNWFLTASGGTVFWPGNRADPRILSWVLERSGGGRRARETRIGLLPYVQELDLEGLTLDGRELTHMMADGLLPVDRDFWRAEAERIAEWGAELPLPDSLEDVLRRLLRERPRPHALKRGETRLPPY